MANNKNFIAKNGVSTGDGYAMPDIYPSLSFNCVNSKTLDPRITFTRGSTATYWDGHTTTKAEENLVIGSDDLGVNNGGWSANNLTRTAATIDAPDGTTTAAELNVDTTNNTFHFIGATGTGQPSLAGTVTLSVYCKANDVDYAYLCVRTDGGSNRRAVAYYLSGSGSIADTRDQGSPTGGAQTITSVGNGWYRCTLTLTNTSGTILPFVGPHNDATLSDINGSYSGVVGEGIYAWGAQLEYRDSATSYTATTSAPIVKYQPTLQTAASGVARFDHYPVTGESRGLMLEPEATNVINQSEAQPFQFSNIYSQPWINNEVIAPDGTQTADTVAGARIDPSSRLERSFSYASGTVLTLSFYQKILWGDRANTDPVWAFQNSPGMQATFGAVEDVGNGWARMHYVITTTAASQTLRLYYNSGMGADDKAALWGYQIEVNSFPTSYIKTSGSTATRPRDTASFNSTQTAEVLNVTEGTIYGEAEYDPDATGGGFGAGIGISTSNYLGIFYSDSSTAYIQPTHASIASGASTPVSGVQKAALTWDGTVVPFPARYAFNGTVGSVDNGTTTGTISPLVTYEGSVDITLGRARFDSNSAYGKNMWLRNFALYPKALGEAALRQMTEE